MVIYANWPFIFHPKWVEGWTPGPIIFIRPQAREDYGLLVHEEVHRRQYRRMGWFRYAFGYLFNRTTRLAMELEAYREQVQRGFLDPEAAADYLMLPFYRAGNVSRAELLEALE